MANGTETPGRSRSRGGQQPLSTSLVMSGAAVAMALIAIFGEMGSAVVETATATTVTAALVGLVPWALVAGGVRVHPAVFAVVTLVPAAVIVIVDQNPGGMFPAMLAVVWVVRGTGDLRIVVPTVLAPIAAIAILASRVESAHETGLIYFMGGVGISALSGLMLRRQEQLLREVHALGELRSEHAASEERTRIAREVHDVVAHSLTVAVLNVGGARRALRTDPALADQALERAETVGRESLDSIRRIVGLLRTDPADRGAAHPMPDMTELIDLVDGYRDAGLTVHTDLCDEHLGPVDPVTGLVVYRVIQESLSNVVQHADRAPATVRIAYADGAEPATAIVVEITNEPPPVVCTAPHGGTRTGLGVSGMEERVRAVGGTLTAGPTPGGGWRVTAIIPWHARPATSTGRLQRDAAITS